MARSASTMVDELLLPPPDDDEGKLFDTEAAAIDGWADAHQVYFEDAESNGIGVSTGALGVPRNAMAAAMTGLSTAGAAAIQAGIMAFWNALVAAPPTYFTGATLITPPPGLATIASDIMLAAPVNVSDEYDAPTALDYLIGGGAGGNLGIHTLTLAGATATFPGPVVAPIL